MLPMFTTSSLHELNNIKSKCLGEGFASVLQVFLIEEPVTAAIGANLPISEAMASMVVEAGSGLTKMGSHPFKGGDFVWGAETL
jgi:actin-like ATPase involved in cell morphogenesis